jgi:DEAD/DEAH box helicase domain-containing protein
MIIEGNAIRVKSCDCRRKYAQGGQIPDPSAGGLLPPALDTALSGIGAGRLYSRQAQAINAVRAGQHVILSSGKTLAYNVPVLEALVEDWRARALYLLPTKALAQDQLGLHALIRGKLRNKRLGTYDGDTPQGVRARLRREASILLTDNP